MYDDTLITFEKGKPVRLRLSQTMPVWDGTDGQGRESHLYIGHQDKPDRNIKFFAHSSLHEEIQEASPKEHQELEITKVDDWMLWDVKKLNKQNYV